MQWNYLASEQTEVVPCHSRNHPAPLCLLRADDSGKSYQKRAAKCRIRPEVCVAESTSNQSIFNACTPWKRRDPHADVAYYRCLQPGTHRHTRQRRPRNGFAASPLCVKSITYVPVQAARFKRTDYVRFGMADGVIGHPLGAP